MQTESISLEKLLLDPTNARKHDKKNLEAIKGSLSRFGQQKPIVVDKDNVVIAGNGTLEAARELGWKKIDIVRTKLKGSDRTAFALADNRTTDLSEWDDDVLGKQLQALYEEDYAIADIGFDPGDYGIEPAEIEGNIEDDQVPETEENEFGVERGQIWQLGEHRVMCGDSTSKDDVDRLMNGELSDFCFTSPPYGQQRDYGAAKEIIKDWDSLMNGVFSILPVNKKAQVFVNLGLIHRDNEWIPYWEKWMARMSEFGWRRFGWYVWDQGSGLMGNWSGRLAPSFEFIWHFNKESIQPRKTEKKLDSSINRKGNRLGLRGKDGKVTKLSSPETTKQPFKIMDSVIRQNRHLANDIARKNHPATFPIDLPLKFIEAYSDKNQICFEPFLGSGSTLIACEKTNRKCYGMEIDPHYCSVIIKRWQDFTGKTAKLINGK